MISSSDSDEDCYSNVAKKLQKLKNKYQDDKIESTNLLDDSLESENAKKTDLPNREASSSYTENVSEVSLDKNTDDIEIEKLLATCPRRVTRASTRRQQSDSVLLEDLTEILSEKDVRNKSKRGRGRKTNTSEKALNTQIITLNSPRAKTRGRGRRSTGRSTMLADLPIYSVGNTSEYPDLSENINLFSSTSKSDGIVIIDDSDILEENEELSVKIYWQSSDLYKFTIRRFQKLAQIFKYFEEKENVNQDKLLFTYNDQILKPDDTPDSINYSIVKFIEGGIVNQNVTKLIQSQDKFQKPGIKIKFQYQNLKKPFEITVQPEEKLSLAMVKFAEHVEIPINKLKFEFDGDSLSGSTTPKDLELEGGECIDVKILR